MLSDGVLNPSGVRFGSSEIYNILAGPRFSGILSDAIVVGQQRAKPPHSDSAERVLLFVKCSPQHCSHSIYLCPEVESAIREQIAKDLSRRHVPHYTFQIQEVPYNANGKKLEIQVRAVLCGGKEALDKLKVTQEEFKQLKWFERFYDIENFRKATDERSTKL